MGSAGQTGRAPAGLGATCIETSLSIVADMLAASADRKQRRQSSFDSSCPSSYLPPSTPKQIGCLGHFFAVY